ncbi:SIN1-domain-containing protein [Calocera viscosa TUFC12733]|uniref:SIN1-domain-containing protein n=1 Tax=Calocera viscosa (strain TUFC12733) TaxID=1330018 RepID=A0A167P649_CALVF|nr:SIN1-domain-containing protein [Calocera viscosa TUFC12733]
MSLISDPDYVIHNLRLNYLRHVDDPYGPRIISISQKHCANPLVVATGLDDPEIWPELRVPASPKLAAIDPSLANGSSLSTTTPSSTVISDGPNFGATGLKYSETIYGGSRTGGAGMRVSGKYASNTPRNRVPGLDPTDSSTSVASQAARVRSDSAPTPSAPDTGTNNALAGVSTSPDGSDKLPQATPRRRGSAGTALTRFSNDTGRPQISNPVSGSPGLPATNGIGALPPNIPSLAPAGLPGLPGSFHAPMFARAAEMEARRRERMRQRIPPSRPPATASQPQPVTSPLTPSMATSSKQTVDEIETPKSAATVDSPAISDEDVDAEDEEDEDEDEDEFRVASTDAPDHDDIRTGQHDDEFDPPDLLRADSEDRPIPTSIPSDELSIPSQPSMQSVLSTSQSSAFAGGSAHLQVVGQLVNRSRLSPVTENRFDEQRAAKNLEPEDAILGKMGSPPEESFFDSGQPSSPQDVVPSVMVSSASEKSIRSGEVLSPLPRPLSMAGIGRGKPVALPEQGEVQEPSDSDRLKSKPSLATEYSFAKRAIPIISLKSALTAQLASQFMPSDNPFTDLYAAVSGRAEPSSTTLALYFPHSRQNSDHPVQVTVRKDASVEEVIGFALWTYWDQGLEPRLDEGLLPEGRSVSGDKERETRLTTIGWCLRMVEEDGEPDEDFPALDRSRPISKFSFDSYAVCEATEDQVKQNEVDNAAIVRRPSRLTATRRQNTIGGLNVPESKPGTSVITSSGITALANTAGLSGLVGPPIFLRVRMAAPDAPHFSTTIHTTSDTYLADVLDAVCRKRRLPNSKEWGLMTSDMTIAIPLDRTVASLEGKHSLVLVSRTYLQENGFLAQRWKTTDPNASIYHTMADTNDVKGTVETGYKKFNVHRKMPVLGRHERTLAIDGHYIHILPSNTIRAFAGSSKTSSHHITAVISCKQSRKVPQTVKLVVLKDNVEKRYELEAENVKEAAEIVSSIKGLQKSYQLERNGTYPRGAKVRRSRVVA